MSFPLADYQKERAAFDALLETACENRILLLNGESGSGKTTLLSSCHDRAKRTPEVLFVNIDLKGTAVTVAEILSRTSERLGQTRLKHLKEVVSELAGFSEVELENVKQSGFANKINITLQANDPADREQRRVALTEALFADLRALRHAVLFVFDTYQDASTEVQDWTGGMIPKLESILELLRRGVKSAHIINGTTRNALLAEVFTDKGTGTMIVA